MTKQTLHLLFVMMLAGIVAPVAAQNIKGNVYGGGEMAKVDGSTHVIINAGRLAADVFGGGEGKLNDDGTVSMAADVSHDTHVTIRGGEFDVTAGTDGKPFAQHHNIYGGGNIAGAVAGTHLHITKGMVSNASDGSTQFLSNTNDQGIAQAYYHEGRMFFCIFGGGYGKNTSVTGDTWVDFYIDGMKDVSSTAIEDDLLEHQSYLDIIGGGLNGAVRGNTNVHIGGNAMCRNVYGGGLYATIGTPDDAAKGRTNVHITGGNVDNVYGGGVMGDILTATYVEIGLHEDLLFDGRTYTPDNGKVTVLMSVYGGNDVSGKVPTANVAHHGGEVDGNIFGAGNGDYIGYYTPGLCDYAEGENDNYYYVDHSADTGSDGVTRGPKGNTYKGRPQTGNVNITIAGSSTTDRASVLGQVFGGGNSCTVGDWDAAMLAPEGAYHGDPHLVRDDPAYFLGGGSLNITLGSHVKIGRTHAELAAASDDDREAYLAKGENVSGLYMGCSGRHLATQGTSAATSAYHHYYDALTARYYPGFAVFAADGQPLSRAAGLASFHAYLNNILVWSDDVQLSIADDVEDVWLSNFVGGGFRGSMKAKTAVGQFHYSLPRGVTVGHDIVGGAYNTDVVYRVYDTESDMHTYKETDGHYCYRTDIKAGWQEGDDYHHVEYADDGTTITGIVRFYYDGGVLSHDDSGSRRNGVFADYSAANGTPGNDNVIDFSGADQGKGLRRHKGKALLCVDARCQLEPEVIDGHVHGGNVFGGCFESGTVDGDIWTDYRCYIAPTWYGNENFNGGPKMFDNAADYQQNFAMMAFGAGYGKNTSIKGDAYLRVIYNKESGRATYPCLYNVFGGSFQGTVDGNTNIYYNAGQQGLLVGGLYGGGSQGYVAGKSFVELAGGYVANVYGGAREANVGRGTHVWAYDGALRHWADDLAEHDDAPLVVERMFGGSDVSGLIGFEADATDVADESKRVTDAGWTAYFSTGNWPEELFNNRTNDSEGLKRFDSYIQVGGTDHSTRGYPLIGQIYAGGNGENTGAGHILPGINTALMELNDGNVIEAFGGGNAATIHEQNYILTNGQNTPVSEITLPNAHLTQIMKERVLRHAPDCYTLTAGTFSFRPYHIQRLFGGNNVATMDIQPKWNLKSGRICNVYSGGNMGDMTCYNPTAATTQGETKGLCIEVNSDNIYIDALYGGCRMSDVKALDNSGNIVSFGEDEYGATVNVKKGHIGSIYGGNDVSGYVYNGTNVNLQGSITGNLYGAGNGNYLYAYDKDGTLTAGRNVAEIWNDDLNRTVYYVQADSSDTPLQQMLSLNNARPHVAKAYLNIEGTNASAGEKVYINGSVYCGGNASTIRPATDDDTDAFVKFNIGNNVIANEIFMGSNGEGLKDIAYLNDFVKVNPDIKLGEAATLDWSALNDSNTPKGDKELLSMDASLRDRLYPSLLSVYMRAVEMKAMPVGFTEAFSGQTFTNTWIGTFCMGGNAGSMMVDKGVEITFPESLKMFGRIIGGSKEASFAYQNVRHEGGFLAPLTDAPNTTKMKLNVNCEWYPKRMDMADAYRATDHLVDHLNDGSTAWMDCCNIYGGCFRSGTMVGDVVINTTSDLLRHMDDDGDGIFKGAATENVTDENRRTKFSASLVGGMTIGNVYGAGYGPESDVQGNTRINMLPTGRTENNDGTTRLYASANNIYGGGRSGALHGNSYIQIHDGHVFTDVVGGCDVATMYGSTFIGIGRPTYYECTADGQYSLSRSDTWNDDKGAIKKSVWCRAGDYVAPNVWSEMSSTGQANFTVHAPSRSWTQKDDIIIRGGVYGGGYSLANNSSGVAGSYTVKKIDANYGGNSTIVVADEGDSGSHDHISISTLKATALTSEQMTKRGSTMGLFTYDDAQQTFTHLADGAPDEHTTYYDLTGDGGIYGDGHLTFCEGFRAADITGYGYNTASVKHPRLMNTFQRLDLLDINDCCLMAQGAQDFATTEKVNATTYSMTRIGELRMNSTLDAGAALGQISRPSGRGDGADETAPRQRNYLGFFNDIHYLGSIATNDAFDDATFHDAAGAVGTRSYRAEKVGYINAYSASGKDADDIAEFKKRNAGTARNAIGINNGFCLRVQNQYAKSDGTTALYYGPIVGVCEVKLLTLTQGEGGGYVYADNVHADADNFLHTSGNFVFPGVIEQGNDDEGHPIADQYIVDDCFTDHFGTPADLTTKDGELDEAHYWYVEGNKYFYNTTLTGYTFQDGLVFELIDNDPNVVLSGMQKGSTLNIKKIEWLSTHRDGYDCVLENSETSPEKTDDYEFTIEIAGTDNSNPDWKNHMPRHSTSTSPYTTDKSIENDNLPQFNVRLQDKLDNSGDDNYTNHLDEPERVKIYLEGMTGGQTYEYTITLDIVYLQGPTYEGGVVIRNCALPGEHVGFSSGGITIKTPDLMPVTAASWQVLPFKEIDSEDNWKWDNDHGTVIPASMYEEDLDGNINGAIKCRYDLNESNIAYIFTAGGHNFPVLPDQTLAAKEQRMLVVHNYHRMKDLAAQGIEASVTDGARVYIKDVADLTKFVEWVNAKKLTSGVDFILQNDIMLTSALTLTQPFAGTFHGDGYHIDLAGKQSSLFADQLAGKVYNLGLIGGTSIADNAANVINSYVYTNNDDFTYGKKAYQLSHAFNPTTDHNDYDDYVATYYANGDYQYARHTDDASLRTAESPNYGSTDTHHLTAHTHDARRWDASEEVNKPLYDGSADAYANDYLFFGQHLDKVDGDAYPVHIEPVANGDADAAKGGNRIYETSGFDQSKEDSKFYYNKDAWALHPTLTAIDYTNMTAEGDGANAPATKFSVDSNKDYGTYSNETTGHVTQNLLVYNAGEPVFSYADAAKSDEADVAYHNIANGSTDYFHLVDKQDFNAPIAFNVNTCAWYERMPKNYRNLTDTDDDEKVDYDSSSAWEGICLPFTATKVTAEKNGEISHFYGEIPTGEGVVNDRTLHHEYWLSGMVAADGDKATFARPAISGGGLFVETKQTAAKHDYLYQANDYFTSLFDYNNHLDTRDDEGEDAMGHHDKAWYAEEHTFADYVPLTAEVPYIVAFPGDDFYEFSMESVFMTDAYRSESYNQKATFESGETTIKVSDDNAASTTVGTHTHNGTYLHKTSELGMNNAGTAFEADIAILPFRTYMTSTASSAKRILITGGIIEKTPHADDYDDAAGETLKIHVEGDALIVESTIETTLPVYNVGGMHIVTIDVKPGITRQPIGQGIYIVHHHKYIVR